jgi:ribosomal protein S17E
MGLEVSMGNIRCSSIKKACKDIYDMYPNRVTSDFDTNKKLVKEVTDANKMMVNRLAGYLVVLANKKGRLIIAPKKQKKVESKKKDVKKQFRRWV